MAATSNSQPVNASFHISNLDTLGQRVNVKIPTQGKALSFNFLWVIPPPLTTTLGLNIDRCINCSIWFTLGSENETNAWRFFPAGFPQRPYERSSWYDVKGRLSRHALGRKSSRTSKDSRHTKIWYRNPTKPAGLIRISTYDILV